MKDLLILTKIEELDAYSHTVMIQFPKIERHVLCAQIRDTLTEIIKLTVRAGKKYYKKTTLQDLDIEIEYLRSLIRKAHRIKYINTKRYEIWIRHVNEIGKMAGGWIKSING
ncbi:MAG: diversity-generating retroelement protein Avd [Desulfotignum sp.]|nr:diversity-generating retroelement protein Avd [Desulfotignum sp.]